MWLGTLLSTATLYLLQWTILVLARPSALPPIETITLKCQPNTQGYPITLEIAKNSGFLKSSTSEVVVLGTSDCEKGLPIIVKVLNGGILTMTRENFGYIFPLASQLDILLHKECIRFFLDHSDLIHEIKDQNARDELETLLTVREKLESLGYNDWKRDLMDDNKLDLGSAISCAVENVEWLTNALNSGSLRHLKVLYVNRQKISKFSLLPKHPLRLEILELNHNLITDVTELMMALNHGKLPFLEYLSLSENQIKAFPLAPKKPLNIVELSMARNQLTSVNQLLFSLNEGKLPKLERLNLDENKITTFPLNPKVVLKLKTLFLGLNQIKNAHSIVLTLNEAKLPDLEQLFLSYNAITEFTLEPKYHLNLKSLSLSNNQIQNVDSIIMALNEMKLLHLEEFKVSNNSITEFPIAPNRPLMLKKLLLAHNKIENADYIVKSINEGKLLQLEALVLDYNKITSFVLCPTQTLNLKMLFLGHNQLEHVDSIIISLNNGQLPLLEYLNLNDNKIATFTLQPKQFLNLKYLYLGQNQIETVDSVLHAVTEGMIPQLEEILLPNNKISEFPLNPTHSLNLKKIALGFNQIENIELLIKALNEGKLSRLERLVLDNNKIKSVPLSGQPGPPNSLIHLALNNNRITDILPLVQSLNSGKLQNLRILNLKHNQIDTWSSWEILNRPLPNLQILAFTYNIIQSLDDIEPLIYIYSRGFLPRLKPDTLIQLNNAYISLASSMVELQVNRQDIYHSSKKELIRTLNTIQNFNLRQIRIEFEEEDGRDAGGLTRDFVHHLSKEMVKPEHKIFQVINQDMVNDEDTRARPLYYFSEYDECNLEDYFFIGIFIAFAYLKKVPLSVEFAPIFYSLLIDSDMPLQFEDLKAFDMALYNGLNNMKGQPDVLSQFSFCINDTPISDIYGCDVPVTIENQNDYFNAFANFMIKKKYKEAIKAISSAFLHYFEIYCTPLSLEKLMKTLIPASNIDVSELITHTKFKGFTSEERLKMKTFYSEILTEWDQTIEGKERIESLVIFIRGSKLPMTGWVDVPNIIFHKDVSSYLPVAHTCVSSLNIPFYSTRQEFLNAITQSLEHDAAGGSAMTVV